jgi:sugar phosphate isomerase/epimerase
MKRRDFLGSAASVVALTAFAGVARAVAAAKSAGPAAGGWFAQNNLPIGIQLYTLGDELDKDFEGVLGTLGKIGYKRVELAGFYNRTGEQLRKLLDAAGLECRSAHVPAVANGPGHSLSGDLSPLLRDAERIGLTDIVLPMFQLPGSGGPPKDRDDFVARIKLLGVDDYMRTADLLNDKAVRLKAHGLHLSYHNHNPEFAPLPGGKTGLQLLLEHTDPALVTFELDVGWVGAAGVDPAAFLQAHHGRFRLMHVKDIKAGSKPNFELTMDPSNVGAGSTDWKAVLPAGLAAGANQFFVEQEAPFPGTRMDAARAAVAFLSAFNT